MNKGELITSISEKCGFTKKDAAKALEAFIESVKKSLANGDKVVLVGFGTFEPRTRPAHKGVNPKTREEIAIPSCKTPGFKAGKDFKTKLND